MCLLILEEAFIAHLLSNLAHSISIERVGWFALSFCFSVLFLIFICFSVTFPQVFDSLKVLIVNSSFFIHKIWFYLSALFLSWLISNSLFLPLFRTIFKLFLSLLKLFNIVIFCCQTLTSTAWKPMLFVDNFVQAQD